MKNLAASFLTALFLALAFPYAAYACTCLELDALDITFEETPTIAKFRVKSVENDQNGGRPPLDGSGVGRSAILVVEKVYKGNISPGEEYIFYKEGLCIFSFIENDIGDEFLLFLSEPPSSGERWYASHCSRSGNVKTRAADLLYLDKLADVVGRSRLSGSVNMRTQSDANPADWYYKSIPNTTLRIKGNGREFQLKTDQNGVFEIYDLSPGKYEIFPPTIKGYSFSTVNDGEAKEVQIRKGKHTETSFFYEFDNSLSGSLLDSSGQPMSNVCELDLVPTKFTLPSHGRVSACTDRNGKFSFSNILPGEYILVGNKENKITSRAPFPRFYYPNSPKAQEATSFSISPGVNINGLRLVAPSSDGVMTVTGQVLFSDGKPWAGGSVWFHTGIKKVSEKKQFNDSDSLTTTDENGRFRIRILKGNKGILSGSFLAERRDFAKCRKILDLIDAKRYSLSWADLETVPFEIDADQDLTDVILGFPFPSCDAVRPK